MYCDIEGNGTKDPALYESTFLQRFMQVHDHIVINMPVNVTLPDFYRQALNNCPAFKLAWSMYRQHAGQIRSDEPGMHTNQSLAGCLDFMGQAGLTAMMMGGMSPPPEEWAPNKRFKVDTSGFSEEKVHLIGMVKDFQKSGWERKEMWLAFAARKGPNKDPARFDEGELREFLRLHGVL